MLKHESYSTRRPESQARRHSQLARPATLEVPLTNPKTTHSKPVSNQMGSSGEGRRTYRGSSTPATLIHWKSVTRLHTREELVSQRERWRREGKTVVFTNGCYDLLHPGHIRLLEQARSLGDVLILALNSDAGVRLSKGPGRPLIPESERAELGRRARSRGCRRALRRGNAARTDCRRPARYPGEGRRLVAFHRRP